MKKWLAKLLIVLSVIASVLTGFGSGQAWASTTTGTVYPNNTFNTMSGGGYGLVSPTNSSTDLSNSVGNESYITSINVSFVIPSGASSSNPIKVKAYLFANMYNTYNIPTISNGTIVAGSPFYTNSYASAGTYTLSYSPSQTVSISNEFFGFEAYNASGDVSIPVTITQINYTTVSWDSISISEDSNRNASISFSRTADIPYGVSEKIVNVNTGAVNKFYSVGTNLTFTDPSVQPEKTYQYNVYTSVNYPTGILGTGAYSDDNHWVYEGRYTVYIADDATDAKTDAQAAQVAAVAAQTAANAASAGTNTIINSYLKVNNPTDGVLSGSAGVIQDSSGNTVLQMAKDAKTYANTAATNAGLAQTAANNAVTAANDAKTAANTAAANAGTAATAANTAAANANNAYNQAVTATNAANTADTDIKSTQTNLSNQLGNLQNNITNNFSNLSQFLTPNLKKISGSNGATATSGSSMQLVLDYNNATDYRYSVDGGSWSGWSALSGTTISVPLNTIGSHTITVQIRNGSGTTAPTDQSSINVFKL